MGLPAAKDARRLHCPQPANTLHLKQMKQFLSFLGMILLSAETARAASLFAYAIDINAFNNNQPSYVTSHPYMSWSPSAIQASFTGWIPAGQFLVIQTNQLYDPKNTRGINWGIQVFTDNTGVGNASPSAPPYHEPDYYNAGGFVPGGIVQGALTPRYIGRQSIQQGPDNILPKSGLISVDLQTPGLGETRLPLIWSFYDVPPGPPFTVQVPPITQFPDADGDGDGDPCDFTTNGSAVNPTCEWFYFRDKGDEKLVGNAKQSIWQNADWYVMPLSREGGLYSVCSPQDWVAGICSKTCLASQGCVNGRFKPTGDCLCGNCSQCGPCDTSQPGCWTSQYFFIASNFRNAARQVYQTTIFVELFVL